MTIAQAELLKMNARLALPVDTRKKNAHEAAQHSMRLLVRAANQDRGLLEDLDWQSAMTHLNELVKKEA